MKFRRNKIKREHSIIQGALDWLEDLSKNRDVTDIIPGVIDVTHSKERGIAYQYETPTGCKLLLKSGGSIQEAFVVTKDPQAVKSWVAKIMEELDLLQTALDLDDQAALLKNKTEEGRNPNKARALRPPKNRNRSPEEPRESILIRDKLLAGIKEEYRLVEINQGLRDSFVESLATRADLEDPKIQDSLEPAVREALENLQKKLAPNKKQENKSNG